MKKNILLVGLAALLLGSCTGKKNDANEVDSLAIVTHDYKEATSFNDSLLLLMGDIYTGLDSINAQEGLLYNMGQGENVDRRAEIRQNLATIRARLNANKQLLDEMQKKVNASDSKNAVLLKTIDELKARIDQQEAKIAELNDQLEKAQAQISDLNQQVAQGEENLKAESEAKDAALAEAKAAEDAANTVYYAVGTNKELKANGLLEKKVLGRTKVLEGDFSDKYFTKGDRRVLTEINTHSTKASVKTSQPKDSYEFVETDNKIKILKITNPTRFWQVSPYLIIEI